MFIVSLLEDTVVTKPHELQHDATTVIIRRLSERLSNKVVPNLGLCICVYDIKEVGSTYILPGEGYGHTRVKFRMVVFRPFIGEVIDARVMSSDEKGLTLSIDFFDDMFIPADKLPEPHKYEEQEKIWYWEYADGEETAKLYMDPGKLVRFRVVENKFKDIRPDLNAVKALPEKSYEIVGTMAEQGLGCIQWWTQEEICEDEDMKGEPEDVDDED